MSPVIERLSDMPPGTIGFRVTGEIQREDYDQVLVPELERAVASGEGLRTLYLVEKFKEIDPSALWADAKVGFNLGIRHHDAWVRSAIVTETAGLGRATGRSAWRPSSPG